MATLKDTLTNKRPRTFDPFDQTQQALAQYGSKKDNFAQLQKYAEQFESPKNFQQAMEQVTELPVELAPTRQKFYEDRRKEFDALRQKTSELYKQNKDRHEWAEIAELIGQSIVKLGAAHQGLKSGVDLSTGMKFRPTDWASKQDTLLQEWKTKLAGIESQETIGLREKMAEEKEFSRDRARMADAIFRKVFEEIAAGRKQKKEAKKERKKEDTSLQTAMDRARKSITKRNAAVNSTITKLRSLETELDEGVLDEDKFNSKAAMELSKLGKAIGMPDEVIAEAQEKAKDKGSLMNTIGSFFGLAEEAPEPVPLSEWLQGSVVDEQLNEQDIQVLKIYSSKKATPEQREKAARLLRQRGINF